MTIVGGNNPYHEDVPEHEQAGEPRRVVSRRVKTASTKRRVTNGPLDNVSKDEEPEKKEKVPVRIPGGDTIRDRAMAQRRPQQYGRPNYKLHVLFALALSAIIEIAVQPAGTVTKKILGNK
jgi:hypothetical protein